MKSTTVFALKRVNWSDVDTVQKDVGSMQKKKGKKDDFSRENGKTGMHAGALSFTRS